MSTKPLPKKPVGIVRKQLIRNVEAKAGPSKQPAQVIKHCQPSGSKEVGPRPSAHKFVPHNSAEAKKLKNPKPPQDLNQPSSSKDAESRPSAYKFVTHTSADANKLKNPELHTTMGILRRLEIDKNSKVNELKTLGDLTPKSKAIAVEEVN